MADAFPSDILNSVLKRLGYPIFQSNKVNCLQRIQLRDLESKLEVIRCVIDEAEPLGVLFPDIVGKWVRDLQRVLYELDDLLDEVVTRSMPSFGMLEMVRLRLYSLPFDLTVAPKLKSFNKRLESIVNECYKCNLLVVTAGHPPQPSSHNNVGGIAKPVARKGVLRFHPDYVKDDGEFHMTGRDEDKKKVIKMLFDEDANGLVVWISGNAGVGKTTLCHAVYNDEVVGDHFDSRLWVDYEGIADSIEKQVELKHKIDSSIERKAKTLLVLDGLPYCLYAKYRPDYEYWSELRDLIATSHKGSKILLTSVEPSSYFGDDKQYHIVLENDLSEEHSRSIFEKSAFVHGHDRKEWMIDLGGKIVGKCLGNPALVRAVAILLYQKDTMDLWDYFVRDFDFHRQYHHYLEISPVSQLWPKCQQSVGYLSLFSDEFKFETLIDHYAAHEFTNLSDTMQKSLKDECLCYGRREDKWDNRATFERSSRWDDQISELAGVENTVLGLRKIALREEVRHVSVARPSSFADRQQRDRILPDGLINDIIHKRSLLFLGELYPVRMPLETLDTLASKLRYLRVLDLHDLALKNLPSSLGQLIHLRYLDVSRNDFKKLPKSICRLKNLRTLKLVYCDKLVKLPRHIKNLRHLKNLELNMCLDLTHMPSAIAKITCLERLDWFLVAPHNGGLRYLEHLNNLNGHLSIEFPREWKKSTEDAEQANLKSKNGLTSLEYRWRGACGGDDGSDNYDVLDKLEPCANIKSLSIINFGGKTFPNWVMSLETTKNFLTSVTISLCKRCKIVPPFHNMPKLRSLTLTSMDIEYMQDDDDSGDAGPCVPKEFFPSLKVLKIGRMPRLVGWSRDMSGLLRFPDMDIMEIWNCPRLAVIPPFSKIGVESVLQDISMEILLSIDWRENKYVEIISIHDMFSLPDEFVTRFPMALKITDCSEWNIFWANGVEMEPVRKSFSEGFQRLVHLSIANCPGMKYLSSSLRHLINLKWLEISECSEELDCLYEEDEDGMPWKALQRLRRLKIQGFEKLVTLPKGLQHLPPLAQLEIIDCKALKSCFHFSELNEAEGCLIKETEEPKNLSRVFQHLESLSITNCPTIKSISSSLRHLTDLEDLEISKCSEELDCLYKEEDDGMPWKALQNLLVLKIEGFENLVALPKGLQQLPSLYELGIMDCKSLERGVDCLPQADLLHIKSCPHFLRELERQRPDVTVVEEKMETNMLQLFRLPNTRR